MLVPVSICSLRKKIQTRNYPEVGNQKRERRSIAATAARDKIKSCLFITVRYTKIKFLLDTTSQKVHIQMLKSDLNGT